MGWCCTDKPKSQSLLDFFINQGVFQWSPESPYSNRVIQTALVGLTEFYAAVESVHKITGERIVSAYVILVRFSNDPCYNITYKVMDETCGPYAYKCPKKILDLLTPTLNDYAIKWRSECNKVLEKNKLIKDIIQALKVGDQIKLEKPIKFIDGFESDVLRLTKKLSSNLLFNQKYSIRKKRLIDLYLGGKVTFIH